MLTVPASDMDYCICSVHNGHCTNIQHITFIFACFYICAVYALFYVNVLASILKCVVLVCISAVAYLELFIILLSSIFMLITFSLVGSFKVLQSLQLVYYMYMIVEWLDEAIV